jgi:folate-binding protein YgfZ
MSTAPDGPALESRVQSLLLHGRDALDVLNRVTTNELLTLAVGETRETLFCDFRGRLLHRALVHREREDRTRVLSDSPSEALAAFIDSKVFREDVRIEPGAPPPPQLVAIAAAAFGADERVRIEAGLPAYAREVAEAFNPFEAGLAGDVHLAKGCYTGQEALQRLVTYDSVRRERVRFSGSGAPPQPQDVLAGGEVAGTLTSATAGEGGWLALAIVRIAALEAGLPLSLRDGTPLGAPHRYPKVTPLGR